MYLVNQFTSQLEYRGIWFQEWFKSWKKYYAVSSRLYFLPWMRPKSPRILLNSMFCRRSPLFLILLVNVGPFRTLICGNGPKHNSLSIIIPYPILWSLLDLYPLNTVLFLFYCPVRGKMFIISHFGGLQIHTLYQLSEEPLSGKTLPTASLESIKY